VAVRGSCGQSGNLVRGLEAPIHCPQSSSQRSDWRPGSDPPGKNGVSGRPRPIFLATPAPAQPFPGSAPSLRQHTRAAANPSHPRPASPATFTRHHGVPRPPTTGVNNSSYRPRRQVSWLRLICWVSVWYVARSSGPEGPEVPEMSGVRLPAGDLIAVCGAIAPQTAIKSGAGQAATRPRLPTYKTTRPYSYKAVLGGAGRLGERSNLLVSEQAESAATQFPPPVDEIRPPKQRRHAGYTKIACLVGGFLCESLTFSRRDFLSRRLHVPIR